MRPVHTIKTILSPHNQFLLNHFEAEVPLGLFETASGSGSGLSRTQRYQAQWGMNNLH